MVGSAALIRLAQARSMRRLEPVWPGVKVALVVPLAYFGTALMAVYLSSKTDFVVTLWPPAAILLAALLRSRNSGWPALLLLCFLADYVLGLLASGKPVAALIVAIANTLEGFLIATAIRRYGGEGAWYLSGRWMTVFTLSSIVGAASIASVGSLILSFVDTGAFTMAWLSWASADCLSLIIMAPFLLCWTEPALRHGRRQGEFTEALSLTVLLGIVGYIALSSPLPLLFLIFPLLALTAARTGLLGATSGTVGVALVGLWLTVEGVGPFARASGFDSAGRVLLLQLYILAAALCAIPLAIIFKVRESLAAEVRHQGAISSAALNNMAQALCMFDAEQRLITCNGRYVELYGLPPHLAVPGTPLETIAKWRLDAGTGTDLAQGLLVSDGDATEFKRSYSEMELPDGRIVVVHRRPLSAGGWVATHEDVTEHRRAAQQIAHLANHDPLTDLPNRAFFQEYLRTLIERARRGEGFALLSLDLDRFKRVNDTLGHGAGDELLKEVAARLRDTVRGGDVVTRLGGDEFAILQAPATRPEEAALLAGRIVKRLGEPFYVAGNEVDVGVSIGVAMCPADAEDPADLLRKSDLALYRAKSDGRATHRFFEKGMDDLSHQRRILESQLKSAIQNGEFELHYQPIMDLASGEPVSFEALIRWRHPTRGLVMPDQFISAAEDTGLIVQIGEWVVREACREAATWPDPIRVAVNLSPVQFRSGNIASVIANAALTAGLPPHRLEIELTESVLLQGTDGVLETLRQLRALGIGIALDDFGTGYSSLGYLRTFLFDKIKIDRSFINELSKPESFAIVHATIDLSAKLGMATTAEGVETAEQAVILKSEGCTNIQGYFVSRPLPAPEARKFLAHRLSSPAAEARRVA
jgi:diguanylate cyclase (GGDEF)-like protein